MADETIRNLFEEMAKATPPDAEGYGADRYVNPTIEEICRFLLERGVADPMRARIEYGDCGSHDLWVTYDNEQFRQQLSVEMSLPARMNVDDVRAVFPSAFAPSVPHPFVPAPGEDPRAHWTSGPAADPIEWGDPFPDNPDDPDYLGRRGKLARGSDEPLG